MAENSLLINEPIKLCEAALKNFNHNYEDPLTYTVKFWADILNCLDLGELTDTDLSASKSSSSQKTKNFDHLETLLSNLIQDYSIWHPAINSITDAFKISSYGQKSRKSDLTFYKVLSWYVFYNDKSIFNDINKFLGGYKEATKNGLLQKARRYFEFLVDDPKTVVLQLYAALSEDYDVNFVEENILPRYNFSFIHNLLKKLEVPVYKVKPKVLTVPKSPKLILKTPVERIADFDVKTILFMRAQEERARQLHDRIPYANDIPESTYYYQELKKPEKPKATSVHSFKLTKKKRSPEQSNYPDLNGQDDDEFPRANREFKANPIPKSSLVAPDTKPKENTSTMLRKIATLKNKQEIIYNNLTAQQFGNDALYKKYQAQINLEKAIKNYEKNISQKLAAELSFENAILATNAVTEVKTQQHKILKEELDSDLKKRNQLQEQLLRQRQEDAKDLEKSLKEAVLTSKTNLLTSNQTTVKSLTAELRNLVKQAMAKNRQILKERQEMAVKIRAEEKELKRKFKEGEFNKVVDWYSTNNLGLLDEMSLKEMKLRYEMIQKKNQELNEELNKKIKQDKIEKEERIVSTYERLVKLDQMEKKRESDMLIKSSLEKRASMDSMRSDVIEMLSGKLEAAKQQRMKIRAAQKV